MDKTLRPALIFAAIGMLIRLLMFNGFLVQTITLNNIIFMHMLFILLSVFIGVRYAVQHDDLEKQLKADLKTGIKAGGVYTILSTAFVYVYYKFIDVNYFALKQQQIIDGALKEGTKELDQIKTGVEGFFTIGNWTTVTLLSFMLLTFVYALLVALLNRYVLHRFKS